MIYLELFLIFLKIGAVSFGGGYAMISLMGSECISNGWLNETTLLNIIAISESTPGPIAVNMATFVGSTQGGFLGSLIATFGVVLPSFIIVLLISAILKNLLKYNPVSAFLSGVRPAVVALILGTATTIFITQIFEYNHGFSFDYKAFVVLLLIILFSFVLEKKFKKKSSPIFLILLSSVLGILVW